MRRWLRPSITSMIRAAEADAGRAEQPELRSCSDASLAEDIRRFLVGTVTVCAISWTSPQLLCLALGALLPEGVWDAWSCRGAQPTSADVRCLKSGTYTWQNMACCGLAAERWWARGTALLCHAPPAPSMSATCSSQFTLLQQQGLSLCWLHTCILTAG